MRISTILKYIFILIIMVILGMFLLIVTANISKESIEENVKESAQILLEEGDSKMTPSFVWNSKYQNDKVFQHNHTDAIMINIVYSVDTNNILEGIMKARRNYIPGVTQTIHKDTNGNLMFYGNFSMPNELLLTVNKNPEIPSYEYARYWHGYMVILRPLLVFFNITQIRVILFAILGFLIFLLILKIFRKFNIILGILVLLAFVGMNFFAWGAVIQGMLVMIIALFVTVLVAYGIIDDLNINMALFITGICTAFFDFLTTPLITFLFPVLIYNLFDEEDRTVKDTIMNLISYGFAWGCGYVLFWGVKWLLMDAMYNTNILSLSFEQIIFRIKGTTAGGISKNIGAKALNNNIDMCFNLVCLSVIIIGIVMFIINVIRYGKVYLQDTKKIVYCVCIVLPILWMVIFANHSAQHYHFTYPTLLISVLGVLLLGTTKNLKKNR